MLFEKKREKSESSFVQCRLGPRKKKRAELRHVGVDSLEKMRTSDPIMKANRPEAIKRGGSRQLLIREQSFIWRPGA